MTQLKGEQGQHLIIVRYGPQHVVDNEWVYNRSEIDEAKVIWARHMDSAQNCRLVDYFRERRIWLLEVGLDDAVQTLKRYPVDACNVYGPTP
jgi:hypothetical protein